ncbi:MAG: phenylalanine--tRNA ligase subunit beta [Victivallaceae bacterium]|nr:phenylalanine--tRNA ligase subunit beta [Victivallaceae bacterium]
MNISKIWLSQYVDLGGLDDETLCRRLTTAGIEVEKVESTSTVPDGVVTARIMERLPHPDSDHLSVCKVNDGKEVLQIVCGAPNCDAGKIVPLATIGAMFTTPEGTFKIKKSKLRGVESFGMMCSAAELGISNDNSGLMIFPEGTPLGQSVRAMYPGDTQIEVEVTPNRPDWLSMYGIARDVACLIKGEAVLPKIEPVTGSGTNQGLVTVEAPDLCVRYIGRVIRGIKVGPSPKWMVERLESVGLRSINNVVDVTNFVLMELGQPLHAFDYNKLAGNHVIARRANDGEKMVLLDGKEVSLSSENLVIADDNGPVALAGVMGGERSGISDDTIDLLLESAVFAPASIRRTSRRLGVSSDSSYRYERGVDYDMAEIASARAASLIIELAGGHQEFETLDINSGRPAENEISCSFDRIRALVGIDIDNDGIVDIFRRLGLDILEKAGDRCRVKAPLYRNDLSREADLAEEVARVSGLDKVPEVPVKGKICASMREDAYEKLHRLRDAIVERGFCECVSYSITGPKTALADPRFEQADLVALANPLSPEMAVMRPSLLGGMLDIARRNRDNGNENLALFELDRCFCANAEKYPEERLELIMFLTGQVHGERFGSEMKVEYDFFDMKGELEDIFGKFGIAKLSMKPLTGDRRFKPGSAAEISVAGKVVGAFGQLADKLVTWRNASPAFVAQVDAAAFFNAIGGDVAEFRPWTQYPATRRDIAMIVPDTLVHSEIIGFISKCHVPNLEQVRLFDVFDDEKLRADHRRSMAYSLTFRGKDRTLKDAEINSAVEKLRGRLEKELKIELR